MGDGLQKNGSDLLLIAREAISTAMGKPLGVEPSSPWLEAHGASFVTLQQDHQLRGCIGTLEPHRSLALDVKFNARSAAFSDPRFSSLQPSELDVTVIEVSVLTPKEPILFTSEAQAHEQLRPGIDGILIEYGHFRSTFLPQVWDQLPTPAAFMQHLKNKAGLPSDFWSDRIKLFRYQVDKWSEADISGR